MWACTLNTWKTNYKDQAWKNRFGYCIQMGFTMEVYQTHFTLCPVATVLHSNEASPNPLPQHTHTHSLCHNFPEAWWLSFLEVVTEGSGLHCHTWGKYFCRFLLMTFFWEFMVLGWGLPFEFWGVKAAPNSDSLHSEADPRQTRDLFSVVRGYLFPANLSILSFSFSLLRSQSRGAQRADFFISH